MMDRSMPSIVTGYFNGFSVEVYCTEEMSLLYHMGCFGKGTYSISKHNKIDSINIMRKRQFSKRCYWYKKFGNSTCEDKFLKDIGGLLNRIKADKNKSISQEVIDLVSSDEDVPNASANDITQNVSVSSSDKNVVVVVPNSDSEGEDYFQNLKPKCCINKISLKEKVMLTLVEAYFLSFAIGCLQLVDHKGNHLTSHQTWDLFKDSDKKFVYKYVVYHYFKSKGYIVKPGIKFGGDYLLYKEGPGINHAEYIVIIKNNLENQMFDWIQLLGQIRMANTTLKEVLLIEVNGNGGFSDTVHSLKEELLTYSVRETIFPMNISMTTTIED